MADLKQCEYFVLRYVPDAVKDEFVNIGVVLVEQARVGSSVSLFSGARFTADWARAQCIDPTVDVEMLEALGQELERAVASGTEGGQALLKRLQDCCSNQVQISASKGVLTEDPESELRSMAVAYLESNRRERRAREAGARQQLARRMRESFEQAGVWRLMEHPVRAERYTRSGDPLRIDCGYKPNGVVRLFHGVSLQTEPNLAKVLAFSMAGIREGIARELGAKTDMVALVENQLDRSDPSIDFAWHAMENGGIRVLPISEMGGLADVARRELI
jgi:hypothetical protein